MRKIVLAILLSVLWIWEIFPQAVLNADGEGDTYELINSVLAPNGNVVEVPDCGHEVFGRHIDEIYDSVLQMHVFRFHLHVTPDNDRCKNFDRQRNEIKTYSASPDSLLGVVGEKHEYKWKFKLDSNFQSSSSFSHIHQLKAVGGSYESMPLITLTTRKGSPDKLELRYAAASSQSTIKKVDLDPFKGTWIQATEIVSYGNPGVYSITLVKIDTDEVLFSYSSSTLSMYKSEAEFIRPKWGLYRSLNNASDLRDEMVLFADFSITETIIPDTVKPTVILTTNAIEPVSDKFSVTVTFSEAVGGFTEDELMVSNGLIETGSLISNSAQKYSVIVVPDSTGNILINLPAAVATDDAGNENEAAVELVVKANIPTVVVSGKESFFKLFPNPTSGIVNIESLNSQEHIEVSIYDQSGRVVYNATHSNEFIQINLDEYKKGLYLFQLKLQNELVHTKVLVK